MATSAELALQRSRDAQKRAQDLAWQEAQRLANEQKTNVTQQAEGLAQEAFVAKKQQERTLPNVLAQSGLQGQGYSETTANAIGTSYTKAWNEIMKNRASSLSSIDSSLMGNQSTINQNKAKIDADYESQLANYQAELATAKARNTGGTTKTETTEKKDKLKSYSEYAMEELNGFRFDPYNPQGSREAMMKFLEPYVTKKLMTASQVQKVIDEYLAKYANRSQVNAMGASPKFYDL